MSLPISLCYSAGISAQGLLYLIASQEIFTLPEKQQSTKLRSPELTEATCWLWWGILRTGGEGLLCLFSELSCFSKGFVNLWGFESVCAHAQSQGWLSLNTGGNLIRKSTKLCFTGLRQLRVA